MRMLIVDVESSLRLPTAGEISLPSTVVGELRLQSLPVPAVTGEVDR